MWLLKYVVLFSITWLEKPRISVAQIEIANAMFRIIIFNNKRFGPVK